MAVAAHRVLVASLCLVLLAAAWLLIAAAPESATAYKAPPRWVRTSDGWRRAEWNEPRPAPEPRLHPWLIAAFVTLASTTALVAFPARTSRTELPPQ